MASPDLDSIYSGACKITLDAAEMGHTEEGVRYQAGHTFRDRVVDMYGEAIADAVHVGDFMRVTCQIAEETYANLQVVYPLGLVAGSDSVYLGYTPGRRASTSTKKLILTSLVAGDDFRVVIQKAIVREGPEVPVAPGSDRVWEVTFEGLIDESQSEGKYLGYIKVNV